MKLIIGLVGEKGSGKETFVQIFKELTGKQVTHIRFSDVLYETLNLWNIPTTRKNLQDIAVLFRDHFGNSILSHVVQHRIENADANVVIIDGVRWEEDVSMLRSFPNTILIYITAHQNIRYQRIVSRKEKSGESTTTFEQFLKEEQAPNEVLISKIGNNADYTIENNTDLKIFKRKVQEIIHTLQI